MDTRGNSEQRAAALPPVLAGPVLRRTAVDRLVFWLVGTSPLSLRLRLSVEDEHATLHDVVLKDDEVTCVQVGSHAFIHLIDFVPHEPLPEETCIGYDFGVSPRTPIREQTGGNAQESWINEWAPHLCFPGSARPNFVIKTQLDRILHGSCRRAHHPSSDGLVRVDDELQRQESAVSERPALLMMTGDQIYADDVAAPLLRAIHGLIEQLGLFEESLEGAIVNNSKELRDHPDGYFHRERLLPANKASEALVERFLGGVRKPIFTTSNAQNHLVSLGEIFAMYLLVWSPVCWRLTSLEPPALSPRDAERYQHQIACLKPFIESLPRAVRPLAHIPCYMIFDDHDVSDDWNLSADWEATAYGHPFSKRIVGNALIAYLVCQGWGNNPSAFKGLMPLVQGLLQPPDNGGFLNHEAQEGLIEELLRFQGWGYTLATKPRLVVLDTRTRRWRSEISRTRPSGLLDWEALMEFQQEVMGERSVIVVSATPMFGVKLIEIIQRIFTFFGRPLVVDAENWMAHGGAAHVLFNIFAHSGTPRNFVILSGDVHYSFVYDVRLRHTRSSPRIWQITSSGIKNEFPKGLLEWLDRLNRWLYSPRSPLNWFTKRRRMRVTPRLPTGRDAGERLWNHSGIGLVVLNEEGVPTEIRQLNATTGGTRFLKSEFSSYH